MNLLLACLGLAAIGLPDGALGVAWPSMRAALDLPQAALGLVLAGVSSGTFLAGLVAGRLMQEIGIARVLLSAACVAAVGLGGMAAAPHVAVLMAAAVVLGAGTGTLDSCINASAAIRFSARQVNWVHGCYGIGATVGPLLMTAVVITAGLSWRFGYGVLAIAMTLLGGIFARVHTANQRPARTRAVNGDSGWGEAARHPLVLLQIVLFFVYCGLEVMLGQWSFTVLSEGRGVPPAAAGTWTSAYWVSIAVGRFALGWAVDHIGPDRLLRGCTVTVVLGAVAFAVLPGGFGVIGLTLSGLSLAPIFPTLMSRAPERLGPAIALHAVGFKVSAAMVGAAVVPALAGVAAQWFGLGIIGWIGVATALALLGLHEAVLGRTRHQIPPPLRHAGTT